jgi:hypothetical protein
MRIMVAMIVAAVGGVATATLPPVSDEAKARATETAAKSAWSDKVALYQLCLAQDRIAETYRRAQKTAGKPAPVSSAATSPPCTDPGPYVAQAPARPLEAAGAHSPPETAAAPPSGRATAAQINGSKK